MLEDYLDELEPKRDSPRDGTMLVVEEAWWKDIEDVLYEEYGTFHCIPSPDGDDTLIYTSPLSFDAEIYLVKGIIDSLGFKTRLTE